MISKELETRLCAIEKLLGDIDIRLGRAERLGYLAYTDVRDVAKYAQQNRLLLLETPENLEILLEESPELIRKMPGMEQLQDQEALAAGMSAQELIVLKKSLRNVASQCRQDALEVAQLLAAMLHEAISEELLSKDQQEAA